MFISRIKVFAIVLAVVVAIVNVSYCQDTATQAPAAEAKRTYRETLVSGLGSAVDMAKGTVGAIGERAKALFNMATDFPNLIRSTPKPQPTKKPKTEKGKEDEIVETEAPAQAEPTSTAAPAAE